MPRRIIGDNGDGVRMEDAEATEEFGRARCSAGGYLAGFLRIRAQKPRRGNWLKFWDLGIGEGVSAVVAHIARMWKLRRGWGIIGNNGDPCSRGTIGDDEEA